MQVCFQLLDCDYVQLEDKPVVRLFGKTLDGKTVCVFFEGFKPYFYVLPRERQKAVEFLRKSFPADVEAIEETSRYLPIGFNTQKTQLLKVTLRNPARVPEVREAIPDAQTFEADILFRYRFMADHGLNGMGWYRAHGSAIQTDIVTTQLKLNADRIEPVEITADPKLRFLSFDIEVVPSREGLPDSRRDPIAIISMAFSPPYKGKRSLVLVAKRIEAPSKDVLFFVDEKEMLTKFIQILQDYDPDALVGYNCENFDIPYLMDRLKANNLTPNLGRCARKPLRCKKVAARHLISVPGRFVVDVFILVKEAVGKGLLRLKRYDLGSVAMDLLKEHKLDITLRDIRKYWTGGFGEIQRLLDYARRDAELTLDLLIHRQMLDKFIAIAQVSGLLVQDVLVRGESARVENLLLREFNRRGFVIPNKPNKKELERRMEERKRQELKGALVLKPEVGLHEQCVVYLDFKSLYPSIFHTYNICPTTLLQGKPEIDHIETPFGTCFASRKLREGVFSQVVFRLIEERDKVKKEMAVEGDIERKRLLNARQIALKYMANAFYGYTGYLRARFYVLALANAITSCGREILKRTKKLVEGMGLKVIYGDTDSIQIKTNTEDVEEAERIGRGVEELINKEFGEGIRMKIEGIFKTELILAKKRYVGWAWERTADGWTDGIVMKGVETVRRDWCELTSQTLARVLDFVLKERNPKAALSHVRDVINRLRSGQIPIGQLVITKGLTKSPSSYKGIQPHVELAKKLRKRDPARAPAVGDRLGFVIVKGLQILSQRAEDPEWVKQHGLEIDAKYYIENQILPPLERVFEALGIRRGELLGVGRQLLLPEIKVVVSEEVLEGIDGFVCERCNRSYPRPPLVGKCSCGGQLLFYAGLTKSKQAIL
jgi:DNA polymerase I